MQHLRTVAAIAIVLAGTVALAQDAVTARKDLMKAQGGAVKVLGDMAKGDVAFDAAAAEAAKAKLIETSGMIAAVFEANETGGETRALPAIWEDYAGFTAKAEALNAAATALDTTSLESVQAGMGAIGGACGGCHETFRAPNT